MIKCKYFDFLNFNIIMKSVKRKLNLKADLALINVKKSNVNVNSGSSSSKKNISEFFENVQSERENVSKSVMEFKYQKKRVRILSKANMFPEWGTGVIYWMFRDQRVQDNWALLYAQKLAIKNKVPLYVCFCYSKLLNEMWRHFDFMCKGLKEVEAECKALNIGFYFAVGLANDILLPIMRKHHIGAVVTDFSPLREHKQWIDSILNNLSEDVPLMQVDAHNIVPCWIASDKREYAARTIRPKITNKLDEFLTNFPPVIKHPYNCIWDISSTNWDQIEKETEVNKSVSPVSSMTAGYKAGMETLFDFIGKKLKYYDELRNDPNKDVISNLSPWFHFGHISVQRSILSVKKLGSQYKKSVAAFCEEAIVRKELSDNFCFYTEHYDNIDGAENWARTTLAQHKRDKRQFLYSEDEFKECKTKDRLWNAAQKQLMTKGKMHGFMRMYWAKKILEWSASPEEALSIAIRFNDMYALDGNDPNGYVGCMWSICGIHDQGWAERPIFGKIRYMNYEGCKRKFDVDKFILLYNC